jgi:hypothetical protein
MSPLDLSAEDLLAIPDTQPERLFKVPKHDAVHKEFQRLAAKWHPDVCTDPKAMDVITHLGILRQKAIDKLEAGIWEGPSRVLFQMKPPLYPSGTKPLLDIHYKQRHKFELGEYYVCEHAVVYVINSVNKDLVDNFINQMKSFRYASDLMKQEFECYMPQFLSPETSEPRELLDGRWIFVIKKAPDQILLRDLKEYLGVVDPKHVAWIISCLLNLACFLEFNQITLNDISLDTVYVNPELHTASLLGGWFYATKRGVKLTAVPKRTLNLLPLSALASKKSSNKTDLELIRVTARELLGDSTGTGPITGIPPALLEWTRFPTSGSAKKDYKNWYDKVLPESFGKRHFTKLDVTAEQLYKEL